MSKYENQKRDKKTKLGLINIKINLQEETKA